MFYSIAENWSNGPPPADCEKSHAVVIGTYQRGHLLERSLACYARQSIGQRNFALVVIDDGSTDGTEQLLRGFAAGSLVDVHYFRLEKEPGTWRDSASFINMGLSYALHVIQAEYVFATHPEIMPGDDCLNMSSTVRPGTYIGHKGYYLTAEQQAAIDTVDWRTAVVNVRYLPGFYAKHPDIKGPTSDYQHDRMDQHKKWESWIFGGMHRDTWLWFGGLSEYETWGSVDVDFLARRRVCALETYTPQTNSCYVIHQNHDDPTKNVPTPRDMNAALGAVPRYLDPLSALKPELLNPGRWSKKVVHDGLELAR